MESDGGEDDDNIRVITIPDRRKKKPVPGKDWCKKGPSIQDIISADKELFNEKLANFDVISPSEYGDVDVGTFIRYVTFDRYGAPKLRLGGVLIRNAAPKYWVLRSGVKGLHSVTWSANLQCNPKVAPRANIYFKQKGVSLKSEKSLYKEEVYQAVTAGGYRLVHKSLIDAGLVKMSRDVNLIKPEDLPRRGTEPPNDDSDMSDIDEAPRPRVKVTLRE